MSHHTVLPEPTTLLGKTSRNKELIDISSDEKGSHTHLDKLLTTVQDGILTNHIEDLKKELDDDKWFLDLGNYFFDSKFIIEIIEIR